MSIVSVKSRISLFLVVLLIATSFFTLFSPQGTVAEETDSVTLKVLHTNDIHASIDNFGKLAAYLDEQRATADHSLYLDAGDISSGSPVVDLKNGKPMIELLNAVGLDALTIGNHDFDYGQQNTAENMANSNFPWLAANMEVVDTSIPIEQPEPYKIYDFNGLKVGVFSVTQNPPATAPDGIEGIDFHDAIETAQQYKEELESQTDVLIALTHQGYGFDKEFARQVGFFDLIIGGHSHTTVQEPTVVNGTPVAQAGSSLGNIGNITVTLDQATEEIQSIEGFLQPVSELTAVDPEVQEMVDQFNADLEDELSKVVGTTETGLSRNGRYAGDAPLGNFWTDAMRNFIDADIALTNNGGIRASIDEGDITAGEIYSVEPFGNQVMEIHMTGAAIQDVIEYSYTRDERNQIDLQTSGLNYTITTDALGGYIDAELTVNGEPIDPSATYVVAVPDYIGTGGSGYSFEGEVVQAQAGLMSNAMVNYAEKLMEEEGVINYSSEGRIDVVVDEDAEIPGEVIGSTENGLYSADKTRTDVGLGNLYTDALRAQSGADIALLNNSSVTGSIPPGDIKDSQIEALDGYGNTVVVVEAKGSAIKEMILAQSNYNNSVDLQVSGMHYTLVEGGGDDAFSDMAIELADGTAFDPDQTYTVAYNNYMHGGFYNLGSNVVNNELGPVWQNVVDYVRAQEGPIDYEQGNRISVELPPTQAVSIAEARELGTGERVSVEGVVTTDPGAWGANGFYIQGEESGLYVYQWDNEDVSRGDVVRITGTTDEFNGDFQLSEIETIEVTGEAEVPEPLGVIPGEVNDSNQGELVKLEDVTIENLEKVNDYGTFEFSAVKDGESVLIRVDNRTGIAFEDFFFENGDVVDVTGVSSEFNGEFQVKPAAPDDIFVAENNGNAVTVEPKVKKNKTKVFNKDVRRVADNGKLIVNLDGAAYDSLYLEFNPAQLRMLKDKNAEIVLQKDGFSMNVPVELFPGRKKAGITLTESANDGALAPSYEFTLNQHKQTIGEFAEDVELKFNVEADRGAGLAVSEYNAGASEWTALKSAYSNGVVFTEVNHGGTFSVFQ